MNIENEFNTENKYFSPNVNNQTNTDYIDYNNKILYNNDFTNVKKYLNFSSEKNTEIKNYNLNQLLDFDTETKNNKKINNELIYNEIINYLNNIFNRLKIEDSRNKNFFQTKNNLYSNIKYFLYDLTNFDEEKANKLKKDLDDIKSKYDYYVKNINKISKIDLEILDDQIKNYNEYSMDFLKQIVNIKNIKEIMLLLQLNLNQIINNYFNYKNKRKNILLTNKKHKNFLNSKRNISENTTKEKLIEEKIKNNMIILSKDERGIFNKYMCYKNKNDNNNNIYKTNLIPKYLVLSFFISKKENNDYIMQLISNIKDIFKKYVITYKNNYDEINMKISFCGICSQPKNIINKIKYLMRNLLKEKALIKISLFSNLKECFYKIINKISISNSDEIFKKDKSYYDYYTTNLNFSYLKKFIYDS